MRRRIPVQSDLFPTPSSGHDLAEELAEIDAVLCPHPEWVEWVHQDLTARQGVSGRRGRAGMPARRVLRLALLQRRLNVSLRRLAQLVADSVSLREFVGLRATESAPRYSTIQENIAKIRPETWGRLLQALAGSEEAREHERGDKVRVDCTVVETNVHHPTDSSLLWDSLRTLTRLLKQAQRRFGVSFTDVIRRARKLRKKMNFAKNQKQRRPIYARLLSVMQALLADVRHAEELLAEASAKTQRVAARLLAQLKEQRTLGLRIVDQTRRRVFEGEKVPVQDKVLSIFETHTDLIVKRREHKYGHKVALTVGASGMVLDCVIERGNPGDVTLTLRQLERQVELFGQPPEAAVFDGAFASIENLRRAKELGVQRCAFSTASYLTPEEMAGSRRTYGRLKRFRAGVEGIISDLKRNYGLRRCTRKGWRGFQANVWSAVFAFNLTKLARLRLAA